MAVDMFLKIDGIRGSQRTLATRTKSIFFPITGANRSRQQPAAQAAAAPQAE